MLITTFYNNLFRVSHCFKEIWTENEVLLNKILKTWVSFEIEMQQLNLV